ncbi:MAG TPA: hypothetical protein VFH33_07365, partial [Candidatus Krumholzibacteria bacterium]|nr:hypothetical protein [Candidatus Krumholzibacteria bacterium]
MQKIATVIDRELKWEQPSAFKQLYELRTSDGLVATLTFPSSFRYNATGESADGCWEFNRDGPFHSRILIRACGSTDPIATFQKSWWKSCGTLELPDGRAYRT